MLEVPNRIDGVDDDELDTIRGLFKQLADKQPRCMLRSTYFDGKAVLKDLGISIPPQLSRMNVALGWPSLAVRALAARNIWDGFVHPDQPNDPFGLADVLDQNRFDLELPQAIHSAYKHSVSFITTTLGDEESGEPPVVVMAREAVWTTATWDRVRRRVSAGLAVTAVDEFERATAFTVYLPDAVLQVSTGKNGFVADRLPNPLGVPLIEPLAYDPQLDRPFGRSRISRPLMSLTDQGMRTIARSEVGAEFFNAPQRWIMGADKDSWSQTNKWQAYVGRFLALTKDEDGDTPTVGQFSQGSQQPHTDQFRSIAARAASEMNLDLSQMGVVHDNPSSAEAIYAAKEPLIMEARASNRVFGAALQRVAERVVMLRDDLEESSPELRRLRAKWQNPAFPTPVSAADAMTKEIAAMPWVAETQVALERFGHDEGEILRMMSDKRRAGASSVLSILAARGTDDVAG